MNIIKSHLIVVFALSLITGCQTLPKSDEVRKLEEGMFLVIPKEERLRVIKTHDSNVFFIEYVGTPNINLEQGRLIWNSKANEVCLEKEYEATFIRNRLAAKQPSDLSSSHSSFDPNLYCNATGVADCIVGGVLGLFMIDAIKGIKNQDNKFPVVDGKVKCL